MSGFLAPYADIRTRDGRNGSLLNPIRFQRPDNVGGEIITVPAGATTDGASIPEAAWSLGLAPFGVYWLACVLHDWLYRGTKRSREECDLILWEAMLSLDVPEAVAKVIYNAVRQFGQAAFDEDREAQ
jgi:Protein of unknown function (DUF1353)